MHDFQRREQAAMRRLGQFLALAVLVHMAVLPLLVWLVPWPDPELTSEKHRRRALTVSLVPRTTAKHLTPTPQSAKPKPEKKPEKKEDPVDLATLKGQVVDIPPSPDDTPPDEADYLSEHNTRTERETRSRHASANAANVMSERTKTRPNEDKTAQPPSKLTALELGPKRPTDSDEKPTTDQQVTVFELPKLQQKNRLALKLDPEMGTLHNQGRQKALAGNSDRLKLSVGEDAAPNTRSSAPTRAPTVADLVPEIGVLARIAGAPFSDHLEDVEEGEGTFLNSREFKYASYFNRLKRDVSQKWRPLVEYRRRDPSGNIYGHRARVTVLSVVLHKDGRLKGVAVKRSSGVEFLDREAVSAFRRAQPFPNPPRGLINGNDELIEFPFGFHIDFANNGGLRLPF